MWIVAIGWIYVVGLMAATEPSLVAGIMTFFGYCVLPLSLLFYFAGSKRRRERREMAAQSCALHSDPDGSAAEEGRAETARDAGARPAD
jgi:hypothetical protein